VKNNPVEQKLRASTADVHHYCSYKIYYIRTNK